MTLKPYIVIGLSIILMSACKVDLYSGLQEKEGNEMLALLLAEGIQADKGMGKGGTVTLRVKEDQLTRAMNILSRKSYPRNKYATINEVFPQGGLIQSPKADNARYAYAMSQDIAATLSNIDGVLTARVHLVLPPEESKNKAKKAQQQEKSAKASVFIKYDSNIAMNAYIPQIKAMVANSVEKLDYKNITVVIFPAASTYTPL